MTEQFHRLYERVKRVNDEQKRLYQKVKDYNEGISQMRQNLQSIIKPTEEIKDKFKQEQLKSEDKSYLKDKLEQEKKRHEEIINKKAVYTDEDISKIVQELINKRLLNDPDKLDKLLDTIKNHIFTDKEEKDRLLELLINKVKEGNIQNVKPKMKEVIDTTDLDTFDKVKEFVKQQVDGGDFNTPDSIEALLDVLKKQNKLSNNEYEGLYKEYIDPPKYDYDKENIKQKELTIMRREIMGNVFHEIINKDPVYGIKFQNNRYEIGNKEINLNYDKPNEEVIIHSGGRDYKFTVIGFIELFGTDKAPKISNIKETDYVNYGNLLKVTGFNTNNIDPNTDKIKKNLLVPLLRIMNYI